jgi:hypothetical protein
MFLAHIIKLFVFLKWMKTSFFIHFDAHHSFANFSSSYLHFSLNEFSTLVANEVQYVIEA